MNDLMKNKRLKTIKILALSDNGLLTADGQENLDMLLIDSPHASILDIVYEMIWLQEETGGILINEIK